MMHAICHRKIHATFSDQELRDHYHSFDRLLAHEEIDVFVAWVRSKPSDFHAATKMSGRRAKSKAQSWR